MNADNSAAESRDQMGTDSEVCYGDDDDDDDDEK